MGHETKAPAATSAEKAVLTEAEAAALLGVSTKTLQRARGLPEGEQLPSFTVGTGGRSIRYRRDALLTWFGAGDGEAAAAIDELETAGRDPVGAERLGSFDPVAEEPSE